MKFALISQSGNPSFQVKDGKAYLLNGDEYSHPDSIKNEFIIGIFNYPLVFSNDSYYLRMGDFEQWPDVDFDLIFLANEKMVDYTPEFIKSRYPNTLVWSTIKEIIGNDKTDDLRKVCFEQSDRVFLQYNHEENIKYFQKYTDKQFDWIPHAVDIDYLRGNFYSDEKEFKIFSYQHPSIERNGLTHQFSERMSQKHGIPIVRKLTKTQGRGDNAYLDFLNSWKDCLFHFNLDPTLHYGLQTSQCAALSTINIGGNNDANFNLFPRAVGTDLKYLEEVFDSYVKNIDTVYKDIEFSWERVNQYYSFESIKKNIEELM
jgi:hypothetical protein